MKRRVLLTAGIVVVGIVVFASYIGPRLSLYGSACKTRTMGQLVPAHTIEINTTANPGSPTIVGGLRIALPSHVVLTSVSSHDNITTALISSDNYQMILRILIADRIANTLSTNEMMSSCVDENRVTDAASESFEFWRNVALTTDLTRSQLWWTLSYEQLKAWSFLASQKCQDAQFEEGALIVVSNTSKAVVRMGSRQIPSKLYATVWVEDKILGVHIELSNLAEVNASDIAAILGGLFWQ